MWKKFYSNSGLILLAFLCLGIWIHNALSFFASKNAPQVDTIAAPSPTPSAIGIFEGRELTSEDRKRIWKQIQASGGGYPRPYGATAVCVDGAYSYAANRRSACSQHGGVAQWLSR
jgi:hypothetical protein